MFGNVLIIVLWHQIVTLYVSFFDSLFSALQLSSPSLLHSSFKLVSSCMKRHAARCEAQIFCSG